MRVLGLDYGSKTVGVAVSDPTWSDSTGRGDGMAQAGEQAAPYAGTY